MVVSNEKPRLAVASLPALTLIARRPFTYAIDSELFVDPDKDLVKVNVAEVKDVDTQEDMLTSAGSWVSFDAAR